MLVEVHQHLTSNASQFLLVVTEIDVGLLLDHYLLQISGVCLEKRPKDGVDILAFGAVSLGSMEAKCA